MYLKRKIDGFLLKWKNDEDKLPLIVKGARQIGKTESIERFGKKNYENVVEINFALQPEYKDIFDDGFSVDSILKSISFKNPSFRFIPKKTLIFFDEIQDCPSCATSLKSFKLDDRFDVICSGSLMGIYYEKIESNSVGYKTDYEMSSLDFEEFLWAKGYKEEQIESLYECMKSNKPLSKVEMEVMSSAFRDYIVLGGMPKVVSNFIKNGNFSGSLALQRQLLLDYEEDISKYAGTLDKTKILSVWRKIPVFLGSDCKKFRISKVMMGVKGRELVGTKEWLEKAGLINICYCLSSLSLPLKGNYDPYNYRIYFKDTGLLIASLDDEAQRDFRLNKNFNVYKGAIYENIVADMLAKEGYPLYFYKNEKGTVEMDFFLRDASSLIPVEVKANDGPTRSLQKLIEGERYGEISYGIKLSANNIGYNGKFYNFPYFLSFLLKRFLAEKEQGSSSLVF